MMRFRSAPLPAATLAAVAMLTLGGALACSSQTATSADRSALVARLAGIPSGNEASDRATLDEVRARARALASTTGCTTGTCEVLGLGQKPCGGPWEYVAYCPTTTDGTALRAAATELARVERAFNERYGVVSDCSVTPYPSTPCAAR
jgi:hypothetical protein